jgi:carboxyl-terminal processing protease
MKKISLLFLFIHFSLIGQNSQRTCEIIGKISTLIHNEHFQSKPFDDSLSVYIFDKFIDQLDPSRSLFTKIDYKKLSKHRLLIDNHIQENDCSFMNDFIVTYKFALERKKTTLLKIQKLPLLYNTKDSIRYTKKTLEFDLMPDDLTRIWSKRIRYDILEDIAKLSTKLDSLNPIFVKLEKTTKTKIFETSICKINSILTSKKGLDYDLRNDFLNIFCSYFDPHSNYFSTDAKSSFMANLSTNNLSLGLNVGLNNKEEIIVEEIIPGSPAAASKKFEKNDVILKISNKKGLEYWVSCASLEKIGELFYSDSNKEIELTLRKKNGNIVEVLLKKQVLNASTNEVYSFVVEKDSKVGYINIPNFYSDFDNNSGKGCAEDVAREISKLQSEDNILGLVIDLQNNGGGSMDEAIKLAGMFIDSGPISILVDKKRKQTVIKDINKGKVYDGPIVVLINGNSASASEFFAAAMQDYNRAIVIGSKSLGKATMQTIVPLDDANQQDFVKLTTQKFYRITGDSHQIQGVIPDVAMPVLFDSISDREESYKTAIKYDVIDSQVKYIPLSRKNITKMMERCEDRLTENLKFASIKSTNDQINKVYNKTRKSVRLTLKDVFKDVHELDELLKKVKTINETVTKCKVTNANSDQLRIQKNPFLKEINNNKMKEVKTNPYLEEATAIVRDYYYFKNISK